MRCNQGRAAAHPYHRSFQIEYSILNALITFGYSYSENQFVMLLMNPKFLSLRAAVLCALFLQTAWLTAAVTPLPNAHAHNDYHHPRPLLDALEVGFCSVEADVYLVGDELLVAHDREDLVPEKNLKDMYLTPLLEREIGRAHV